MTNSKFLKFNLYLGIATAFFSANSALAQSCQVKQHAPIPKIYGLDYDQARKNLIAAGWQPQKNHWTYKTELGEWNAPAMEWWNKGYWELSGCSGGLVYCGFNFTDAYGNQLEVRTQGQVNASVDKYSFVCKQYSLLF